MNMLKPPSGWKFINPRLQLSRGLRLLPTTFQKATKYTELDHEKVVRSRTTLDIPDDLSLYHFVTADFSEHGNKLAMIDGITDKELTFSNVNSLIKRFGSYIGKQGFKQQDTLAIYLPNCIEYGAVMLGTVAGGGKVSTANPTYTKYELANQLKDSNSSLLVTNKLLLQNAIPAADMAGVDKIIIVDGSNEGGTTEQDVVNWSAIEMDDESAFKAVSLNPKDEIAVLPYSSGTTGLPKGVMLTHHNLISNLLQSQEAIFAKPDRTKSLGLLPFFHCYGLLVILLFNLFDGKTTVTLPKFEAATFLRCLQKHKVDFANLVPPLVLFLAKHPMIDEHNVSSLQGITSGAAPFGRDLLSEYQKRFPDVTFILQGYGLTETSPVAITQPPDWIKPGSTGVPVPNTEVKVVDVQTGETLGPNETGEVLIRGPQVMKGYLNRPDATAETITEDGWLKSGDLGYYDDDHHFYLVDRIKELIKYKGFPVPPAELEDVILSHPSVADTAVIGIPSEEAGEIPLAFVVKKNELLTEEELKSFVEEKVAPHKKLRGGVKFIDAIPKSVSGKILRRVLKEEFLKNQ